MTFSDKAVACQTRNNSWLCVGLDTDPSRIPSVFRHQADGVVAFNRAIIDATSDLVCAYKPNLAFYLADGAKGLDALAMTIAAIPRDTPVILDAKFGDIDSSAQGYAQYVFRTLGADAVTVNPYLGADTLAPFLDYDGKAVFVLAHTSNPGSSQFQDLYTGTSPLYIQVSRMANVLQGKAQVGLVAGATFADQVREMREVSPAALFLIPGVGTQGGSLEAAVRFGRNQSGVGPLINVSRSVLYASSGDGFAQAARQAAQKTRDEINALRGTSND